MGDIPIYNLTILCVNGTLPCVDFMDVIMGDIILWRIGSIPIVCLTVLKAHNVFPV